MMQQRDALGVVERRAVGQQAALGQLRLDEFHAFIGQGRGLRLLVDLAMLVRQQRDELVDGDVKLALVLP